MELRVTGWCTDNYFKKMKEVGTSNNGWKKVLYCEQCGQNWLVDEYDKVQYLFAIKIDDPENLSENDYLELHKDFLLKAHNGESSQVCQMAGCNTKAVNDFAFCAECLITKQGVYE